MTVLEAKQASSITPLRKKMMIAGIGMTVFWWWKADAVGKHVDWIGLASIPVIVTLFFALILFVHKLANYKVAAPLLPHPIEFFCLLNTAVSVQVYSESRGSIEGGDLEMIAIQQVQLQRQDEKAEQHMVSLPAGPFPIGQGQTIGEVCEQSGDDYRFSGFINFATGETDIRPNKTIGDGIQKNAGRWVWETFFFPCAFAALILYAAPRGYAGATILAIPAFLPWIYFLTVSRKEKRFPRKRSALLSRLRIEVFEKFSKNPKMLISIDQHGTLIDDWITE